MDIQELKEYLSHKTWLWQRIFGHFYLAKHGLKMSQLRGSNKSMQASSLTAFCHNKDDVDEFWSVVKYIDKREKIFVSTIEDLRYCRPLSWQYDFVVAVSKRTKTDLLRSLQLDSLADAYCLAIINKVNVVNLISKLDSKYVAIFDSAAQKVNLLRRNFSLILETKVLNCADNNNRNLTFREIADRYVSHFGVSGLIEALRQARTPEVQFSRDENECLSLAFYSSYSLDDEKGIAPHVPGTTLARCINVLLTKETEYLTDLRTRATEANMKSDDDDDDDDDDEKIQKILELKHRAVYVDPTECCLIDVQRKTEPLYAHVYIEKTPQDDLNNSLPDFIRYDKHWLYTVEFVENIKELEIAQEMHKYLNYCKQELIKMEKAYFEHPVLALSDMFRQRYIYLTDMLRTFYLIY